MGFEANDPGHVYFREVYEFLEDAGLKPYGFYDYYLDADDRRLVVANLLFASHDAIGRMR